MPELRHLSPNERQQVLRAIGRLTIPVIVAKSLLIGIAIGFTVSALLHGSWLRDGFPAWMTQLFTSSAAAFVIYCIYMIRIRGGVLLYLEACRKHARLPMCLKCGYSLEGLTGPACPECGTLIDVRVPDANES